MGSPQASHLHLVHVGYRHLENEVHKAVRFQRLFRTTGTSRAARVSHSQHKKCQKTVSQGKTSSGQSRKTARLILKNTIVASVKVNKLNLSVSQAVRGGKCGLFAVLIYLGS